MGGVLKVVGQSIDTSTGFGASLDLGAQYVGVIRNLDLAAGIRNLGSGVKVGDTAFSMPLSFYAGGLYGLWNRRINLVADFLIPTDNALETSLGLEGWLIDFAALRLGYKMGYLNQMAAGAGLRLGDLRMDYAWIPYGELGNTHRLTISYAFGMPSLGLGVNPKLIAPIGEERFRQTRFLPEVVASEKARSWKLTLQNKRGEILKVISGDGPVPGNIPWNGRDESGRVLPDSVVSGRMDVNYGNGLSAKSTLADVELDSTPPEISLDVEPKLLRPNVMGAIIIPAHFKLRARDLHGVGGWKLDIKDETGLVFRTFSGEGEAPADLVWDGSNGQGVYANSGKIYTTVPWAKDSLGNATEGKPVSQVVLFKEIKLTLAADTLFDPGKADVKITNYHELNKVADLIKKYGGNSVEILGHTDNVPMSFSKEYPDNFSLSKARAQAVITFLVTFFKVDATQVKAVGKGDSIPVKANDTPEGRQANRRVEVIIHTTEYR
jgi:flagellar motor protein MotB